LGPHHLLDEWERLFPRSPARSFNQADMGLQRKTRGCSREFFGRRNVHFCSERGQDDRNERRREQRAQERALHKRKPGECVVCGTKRVEQMRSTLRYCSDACRQQAYRSRSAENKRGRFYQRVNFSVTEIRGHQLLI
jgi:hypothetical protein